MCVRGCAFEFDHRSGTITAALTSDLQVERPSLALRRPSTDRRFRRPARDLHVSRHAICMCTAYGPSSELGPGGAEAGRFPRRAAPTAQAPGAGRGPCSGSADVVEPVSDVR